jgi:hypothetical protein
LVKVRIVFEDTVPIVESSNSIQGVANTSIQGVADKRIQGVAVNAFRVWPSAAVVPQPHCRQSNGSFVIAQHRRAANQN